MYTLSSLLNEANDLKQTIVSHRRYIHENAEVHFELAKTRAYVMDVLRKMGYEPQELGGGITAVAGGKKAGKVFLVRADMDALPMKEESDLPFISKTGNMHACGHDFHTSMLLGAAQIFKNHEDEIEGTVKLMFQPAEELLIGAEVMVKAGILENPTVDAALTMHVAVGVPIPAGIAVMPSVGTGMVASDWFEINVQGKGGHGAMPHTCVDPLNVLAHIFIALQEVNAREIAATDTIAFTIGQMHGGSASNIIPDSAFMAGTIRSVDEDLRQFVKQRLVDIAESVAKTFRAEAVVKFTTECPAVINDVELSDEFVGYLTELLGKDRVVYMADTPAAKTLGSEDFAFISQKVPSALISLGAGSSDDGYIYPLHHPMVKFNEDALPTGSAIYAACALEWLRNNK